MRTLVPDVTDGPRARLLECVTRMPGTHLRGLERMTSLPLGQVLYHLDRLERMGLVNSVRDQGFRRYYLSRRVGREEKPVLAALRHGMPRRVLLELLTRGPMAHRDLLPLLGVAGSTLSFHLQRLVGSGVLVRERSGNVHLYALREPEVVRRELLLYGETFNDPAVDAYVQRAASGLPVLAGRDRAEAELPNLLHS